tara:strand:- start:553 stop:786 length:234 start_codon:yes stop_codon:yes gene_type:complete
MEWRIVCLWNTKNLYHLKISKNAIFVSWHFILLILEDSRFTHRTNGTPFCLNPGRRFGMDDNGIADKDQKVTWSGRY